MRLSAKHVCHSTHHGTCKTARVLCCRLLPAMIVLRLCLGLVSRRKEVLRKLTDKLTPKPASATGTMVGRRAMTARAAVGQAAKDLACKTAEIV